ncbi:hypothetical protein J3B02_005766, partial [Coemansia erecta]
DAEADAEADADTRTGLRPGPGRESVVQQTLVPLRNKEPRPNLLTIPSEASAAAFSSIIESVVGSMGTTSFDQAGSAGKVQQRYHAQLGFPTAPAKAMAAVPMASVSQTLASAETMGALYMPSLDAMPQVSSVMDFSE